MTLRFKFRDSFVATSTSMDTTNATEPKKIPPPRTEAICNAAPANSRSHPQRFGSTGKARRRLRSR
jgi:hypothetical protein